ncbi:MAG: flagellar basal body-associated FliL family protein [Nitrospinota bacterium]
MAKVRKTELDVDIISEPEPEPEEPKEEAPEEKPAEIPKPRNLKKLIILASISFLALVVVGVFIVKLLLPGPAPAPVVEAIKEKVEQEDSIPPPPQAPPEVSVLISNFSPFFLPLKNKKGEERFLRIRISVELSREQLKREITKNLIVLRGKIYDVLRKKRVEDLLTTKTLKNLNNEIQAALNMAVQTGTVTTVYFSELTIL